MQGSNNITVWIFPIAMALVLAAFPRDAEAQLCPVLKSKPEDIGKKECVVPSDIKNGSLTISEVKDMAISMRLFRRKDILWTQAPGLVLVTAAAKIDASGATGPVTVRCKIAAGKTAKRPRNHKIDESLNPAEDVSFASIVATKIFRARKGAFEATFSCKQTAGSGAKIQNPGISARYVSTEY